MNKYQVTVNGIDPLYDVEDEKVDGFTNDVASAGHKFTEVKMYGVQIPTDDPLNPFKTHEYPIPIGKEDGFIQDVIKQGYEPYLVGGSHEENSVIANAVASTKSVIDSGAKLGSDIKEFFAPSVTKFSEASATWIASHLTKKAEEKEKEITDQTDESIASMSELIRDVSMPTGLNAPQPTASSTPESELDMYGGPSEWDQFVAQTVFERGELDTRGLVETGEKSSLLEFKRARLAEDVFKSLKKKGIDANDERGRELLSSMVNEQHPITKDTILSKSEKEEYEKLKPQVAGWGRFDDESDEEFSTRQSEIANIQNELGDARREYQLSKSGPNHDFTLKAVQDLEDKLPAFERESQLKQMEAVDLVETLPAFITMHNAVGGSTTKLLSKNLSKVPAFKKLGEKVLTLSGTKVGGVIDSMINSSLNLGTIGALSNPETPIESALDGAAMGAGIGLVSRTKVLGIAALTTLNAVNRMASGEEPKTAFKKGLVDAGFQSVIFGGTKTGKSEVNAILKKTKSALVSHSLGGKGLSTPDAKFVGDLYGKG
ncbi:hypothetical protein HOD41_06020, partial [bacterium]|nr:hypothetical protein [bacterium]